MVQIAHDWLADPQAFCCGQFRQNSQVFFPELVPLNMSAFFKVGVCLFRKSDFTGQIDGSNKNDVRLADIRLHGGGSRTFVYLGGLKLPDFSRRREAHPQ